LLISPALAPAPAAGEENKLKFDFAVKSTVGVSEISFIHQQWLDILDFYDYNKIGTRTSRIGATIGPQVSLNYRSYTFTAEAQFGNYDYRDGGNTSLRTASVEVGLNAAVKQKTTGQFSLVYTWANLGADNIDTLFKDHSLSVLGLGFKLGSGRDATFRWRFGGVVPAVVLTHIFNWKDLAEKSAIFSGDLTFGFKPHRSRLFFDAGYHFWGADHPTEVRPHDMINGFLTFRHGLLFQIGYLQ
jgi:hypothetical protein